MIDLFNAPRMRGMTLATRNVSPGPIGLGSVLDNRTVMLGFETHHRFTVIEWDPPRVMVASLSGPFLRSGRIGAELTATSEGTRQVTTTDIELTAAGILLWPLIGPLARRSQTKSDRTEKALLEASPPGTAAG
jgi:hypothetical protein